jgi:hypothetical protein
MMTKTARSSETVQFELFGKVSPQGEQLVLWWHRRAKQNPTEDFNGPFLRFPQLWFAFNNWAMRVTEAETDRDMIDALAKSPVLKNSFARLLAQSPMFRNAATGFAQFWPIFDVKDIRRKGLRHKFHGLDRQVYTRKMLDARIRHAPEGKFDQDEPTWDQTIQAVYKVRCNLFHGEKGDSSDDAGIVNGALQTMLEFIDATELYQWRSPDGRSAVPVFQQDH